MSDSSLRIRDAQMRIFEDSAIMRTAADILDYLRARVPDCLAGLADAEAARRARFSVGRALRFGLQLTETDAILIWVRIMFTVGPWFDYHPACAIILGDRGSPPAMRIESLLLVRNAMPWVDIREWCGGQKWE